MQDVSGDLCRDQKWYFAQNFETLFYSQKNEFE